MILNFHFTFLFSVLHSSFVASSVIEDESIDSIDIKIQYTIQKKLRFSLVLIFFGDFQFNTHTQQKTMNFLRSLVLEAEISSELEEQIRYVLLYIHHKHREKLPLTHTHDLPLRNGTRES